MNISYPYSGYYAPQLVYQPYELMLLNPAAYAPLPAAHPWECQNLANLEAWRTSTQLSVTPSVRRGVSTDSIKAGRIFWLPHQVAKESVYWQTRGEKAHGALGHPVVVLSDVSPAGTVKCLLLTSWKEKGGSTGKWGKSSTDPTRKNFLALGFSDAFGSDKYLPTDVEDSTVKCKPLLEYIGPKAMDRRSYVDVTSSFEIEPHNLDDFKGDACIAPESVQKLLIYQRTLLNSQQRLRSDWRSKPIIK